MIIRITTEGQYNLPGSFVDELNEIDNELVEAVEAADQSGYDHLLKKMLDLELVPGGARSDGPGAGKGFPVAHR